MAATCLWFQDAPSPRRDTSSSSHPPLPLPQPLASHNLLSVVWIKDLFKGSFSCETMGQEGQQTPNMPRVPISMSFLVIFALNGEVLMFPLRLGLGVVSSPAHCHAQLGARVGADSSRLREAAGCRLGQQTLEGGCWETSAGAHCAANEQTGPVLTSLAQNSATTHQPLTKYQRRWMTEQPLTAVASMAREQEPGAWTRVWAWWVESRKAGATHPPQGCTRGLGVHVARLPVMKGELQTGAGGRNQCPVLTLWRWAGGGASFLNYLGSPLTSVVSQPISPSIIVGPRTSLV